MKKDNKNKQFDDPCKEIKSCSCRFCCNEFIDSLTEMSNKNLNLYKEILERDVEIKELKSCHEKEKEEWETQDDNKKVQESLFESIISSHILNKAKNDFEAKKIELESILIKKQNDNELAKETEKREIDRITSENEKAQLVNVQVNNDIRIQIKKKELDDELKFQNLDFKEKNKYIETIRESLPKPSASNIRLTISIALGGESVIIALIWAFTSSLPYCWNNPCRCEAPYSLAIFIVIGLLISLFSGIWYYSSKIVQKMFKQYLSEKEAYRETLESLQHYLLRFLNN